MAKLPFIVFLILVCSCLIRTIDCDVNAITEHCRFEGCHDLDENDPRYTSPEYYKKLFKLYNSGIQQLIFDDFEGLKESLKDSLSLPCAGQLTSVFSAIEKGREWAFRFFDSSGKTPSAFLSGTVTSLGDYDECLAIQSPASDVIGQYCMVDIFPKAYIGHSKAYRTSGQISLLTPQHFNASAYYFGLCFPSACSTEDVRMLVKTVLEPFPLLVEGQIHCDTRDSISFTSHLQNIRPGPLIALFFLIVILCCLGLSTFVHVLRREKATALQKSFSVLENSHRLFYVSPTESDRTNVLDWVRSTIIWAGVAAHIMLCIESLIGAFQISHHKNMGDMIGHPALSFLFNEAGIVSLTSLSAVGTFAVAYPLAKKGRLPFLPSLLDRVLRHLPGVAVIVAMDFTWYLWGSGPFYTRVGQFQVDKCSKTWWKNLLFVSNLWGPSSQICAGQTYFSSLDVQLFVLGFIAITLLAERPKLGVAYCLTLMASSTFLTYHYVMHHKLTPLLMVSREPSIHKMEEFFIYVHMSTASYMNSYFGTILLCYTITLDWWTRFVAKLNPKALLALALALHFAYSSSTFFPNYLNVISAPWTPYYVIFARLVAVLEVMVILVYVSRTQTKVTDTTKANVGSNRNTLNNGSEGVQVERNYSWSGLYCSHMEGKSEPSGYYSFSKAVLRLTFAVYLSNYYFIRSDFFNERTLYYGSVFNLLKRTGSSFILILLCSIVFQIMVMGPFTNLRNEVFRRMLSTKKNV